MKTVFLNGETLSIEDVVTVARKNAKVEIYDAKLGKINLIHRYVTLNLSRFSTNSVTFKNPP